MPRPSLGAKSLEQIADEIIKWVVTTPIFTNDLSDSTKFSIKSTLPISATETDLIPDVISGEHIGNVKIKEQDILMSIIYLWGAKLEMMEGLLLLLYIL